MLKGFKTTCLAYLHARNFNLRVKFNLQAEFKKNVKPHHQDSNQGPSAYRADALTTMLWCSSH